MYNVDINRPIKLSKIISVDKVEVVKRLPGINKAISLSLEKLLPTEKEYEVRFSSTGKTLFISGNDIKVDINDYVKLVSSVYLNEPDIFKNNVDGKVIQMKLEENDFDIIGVPFFSILHNLKDKIEVIDSVCNSVGQESNVRESDKSKDYSVFEHYKSDREYFRTIEGMKVRIRDSLRANRSHFSSILKSRLLELGVNVPEGYLDVINEEVCYVCSNNGLDSMNVEIKGMLEIIMDMCSESDLAYYAIVTKIPDIARFIKDYMDSDLYTKSMVAGTRSNGIFYENEYVRIANNNIKKYAKNNQIELQKGLGFLKNDLDYFLDNKNVYDNPIVSSNINIHIAYIADMIEFITSLIRGDVLSSAVNIERDDNERIKVKYKISDKVICSVDFRVSNDKTLVGVKSINVNIIKEVKEILAINRSLKMVIKLIDVKIVSLGKKYGNLILKSIPEAKIHFLNKSKLVKLKDGRVEFDKGVKMVDIKKEGSIYTFTFESGCTVEVNVAASRGEILNKSNEIEGKSNEYFKEQIELFKKEYKELNRELKRCLDRLFPSDDIDTIIEFLYLMDKRSYSFMRHDIVEDLTSNDCIFNSAYSGSLKHLSNMYVYDLFKELVNIGIASVDEDRYVKFNEVVMKYLYEKHPMVLTKVKNINSEDVDINNIIELPLVDISRFLMHRKDLGVRDVMAFTSLLDYPDKVNKIQYELKNKFKDFKEVEKIIKLKEKLANGDEEKISCIRRFV